MLRAYLASSIRMDYGWITANSSTSAEDCPITVSPPDSPYAKPFHAIAARLCEKVSGTTPAHRTGPRHTQTCACTIQKALGSATPWGVAWF
jgi:hypothetical protein